MQEQRHDMRRWRGRVALVTGASSGIGRAIAAMLAREGMAVAACARRGDRLESLARMLRAEQQDARILAHPCDLRDEAQIADLFDDVRKSFGGVDVLVNNAGLGRNAPLLAGPVASWREMLDLNVLALCICTKEAVTDMRARGDEGHVIHVSSMAGHRVPQGSGVYSATKFAVRSLTEGLRQELRAAGSRIRVTSISPGFVETEFAASYHGSEEVARETYSRMRCLQSEDIADAVRFALGAPEHVQVHDMLVRPTEQTS
jgi:NADP-dependent 3-hydroxy acid dehydrogenase YdfG